MPVTEQQRKAAIDVVARHRSNPVEFYVPNTMQEKWIKQVGTHKDGIDPRTKILSAANKFGGKTCGSIAIVTNIVWGPQSKWFDYPIYRNWKFPKTIWIISSSAALREVIVPEMKKWFPPKRYKLKQGHKDYPYEWVTDTGFKIWLKTYEEDSENFESTLVGLCLLSEPPPKRIYDAIPPRMSHGGIIMCEMTPLEGSGWLFEDLVYMGKANIIYGQIEEGCKEHSPRGRHSHQKIQTWLDNIRDKDTLIARRDGKPMHYKGAIFKTFNPAVHVVPAQMLGENEQIWFGVDPHRTKPPFAQWWAIDMAGNMRCVLEFPKYHPDAGYETLRDTKMRIEDYCELFRQIENEFDFTRRLQQRVMDPFMGRQRYGDSEYTMQQKYALHGIECAFPPEHKTKKVQVGHEEIKEGLHYDFTKGINPKLTWEEHCRNSIRAMQRYSVVTPNVVREDRDIASETYQLTEVWKHGPDVTRYIVVCNPSFAHKIDPESPKSWREEVLNTTSDWNPLAH